jgi:hypothetical protein
MQRRQSTETCVDSVSDHTRQRKHTQPTRTRVTENSQILDKKGVWCVFLRAPIRRANSWPILINWRIAATRIEPILKDSLKQIKMPTFTNPFRTTNQKPGKFRLVLSFNSHRATTPTFGLGFLDSCLTHKRRIRVAGIGLLGCPVRSTRVPSR